MDETEKKIDRDEGMKAEEAVRKEDDRTERILDPERSCVGRIAPRLSMELWTHAFNRRFR